MNSRASTMDRVVARPAWKRKSSLMAAGVLLAAGIGAALFATLPAAGTVTVAAQSIDTATAKRAPFQDYLALRGEVVPMQTFLLTASVGGSVETVPAADGEIVEAGRKLAVLSNSEFSLGLTSQEAEVSVRLTEANKLLLDLSKAHTDAEAALADVAYALHKGELELEKRQDLFEHGVVNDAYVKPFKDEVIYQRERLTALKAAQAADAPGFASQKRQIEASIEELKKNIRDLESGRDRLTIKAPAAGRLTAFTLKPGQSIKPGDSLGEVDSDNDFKMKALVDEYYAGRISEGLHATALLAGKSWPLTVSKVYRQVAEGRVTIELTFDGGLPADMRPGQTMDLKLSLGDTAEALVVPNGSWLRDSGGNAIFVIDPAKPDHADLRKVSVGRRNPDSVEILGGLAAGERVVTAARLEHNDARHLLLKKGN